MSAHDHRVRVPGCFRCELSADEARTARVESFGEAARAEAERRHPYVTPQRGEPRYTRSALSSARREAFAAGAAWARGHLAVHGPTPQEVEAAARAIWANTAPGTPWDEAPEEYRTACRADARAALTAAARAREGRG